MESRGIEATVKYNGEKTKLSGDRIVGGVIRDTDDGSITQLMMCGTFNELTIGYEVARMAATIIDHAKDPEKARFVFLMEMRDILRKWLAEGESEFDKCDLEAFGEMLNGSVIKVKKKWRKGE